MTLETDGNASPTLFRYQQEGIDTLTSILQREGGSRGALLSDPVGAGKTAQAIGVLKALESRRTLILCPASLKLNWARECEKWGIASTEIQVIHGGNEIVSPTAAVVIVSYSLASRQPMLQKLASLHWDLLICDEAHALKSVTAQVSRAVLVLLWRQCRYRLAITGTPVPNGRAAEAWPLFSRLSPEKFGAWKPFCSRYCVVEETPWGTTYPRSRNLEELGALARESFMVRRRREEVLGELPSLMRSIIPVEVSRLEVSEIEGEMDVASIVAAFEAGDMGGLSSDHIATARRKLGISKLKGACAYLLDALEEVDNLVVFCHHREVFFGIKEALEAHAVPLVHISGSTSAEDRQAAVDTFQNHGARVFLASITAANAGITLTAASTVVFVEFDFVPSVNEQAEGRIWRLTQKDICRAQYLVVPESLDEKILSITLRKQRDISKVLMEA